MVEQIMSETEKSGARFCMDFLSSLMDVVREKAYSFDAISRLATASGRATLVKMVDLAHADWQAEQPKLIDEQQPQNVNALFSAPVVYVQPELEELRRLPVDIDFDYDGRRFNPIAFCRDVSKENRVITFEYVHLDRDTSTVEVLVEMDRKGLRPALYEELLGFVGKYPDEQCKHPIVALGSEMRVDSNRHVACLWCEGERRCLGLYCADGGWNGGDRFLAVRK